MIGNCVRHWKNVQNIPIFNYFPNIYIYEFKTSENHFYSLNLCPNRVISIQYCVFLRKLLFSFKIILHWKRILHRVSIRKTFAQFLRKKAQTFFRCATICWSIYLNISCFYTIFYYYYFAQYFLFFANFAKIIEQKRAKRIALHAKKMRKVCKKNCAKVT